MKASEKSSASARAKPIKGSKRDQAPKAAIKAPGSKRRKTNDAPLKEALVERNEMAAVPAVRVKLVRDSFTMPREDFELVAKLKARALEFKRPTKKSELLRAGLQQLAALSESQLQQALMALRPLPTGRPKKKH